MSVPDEILQAYGWQSEDLEPISIGHINRTYSVRCGGLPSFVLQRLNPVFSPDINTDIDAITQHLEDQGLETPRLHQTTDGHRFVRDRKGGCWRATTHVAGSCIERVTTSGEAAALGSFLGKYHRALATYPGTLVAPRRFAHDTAACFARLDDALAEHGAHRFHSDVAALRERIHAEFAAWPALDVSTEILAHGDPKVSNFMWSVPGQSIGALVDLDTLGPMALIHEMGDAFRSWCQQGAEDDPETHFRAELFEAASSAYAATAGALLNTSNRGQFPAATAVIALELASRFAADTLNERYFGWDPDRFSSRGAHNLARSQSQLRLGASIRQTIDM